MNRFARYTFIILTLWGVISCTTKETSMPEKTIPEGANRLYLASSPYLKQHAFNPVDWYPWGEEALEKAKKEDKPILVSIGYSSCHWCHVMERESFENDSIAKLMNTHFINIKVDREERPDVDQVYMDAVQAMGLQGGWPLNVFLTPDQKPFYGGTYFPPKNWFTLLTNIHGAYVNKREEINSSANDLADALSVSELLKYKLKENEVEYSTDYLQDFYTTLAEKFDSVKGGFNRAPKFPMPVNWKFMLQFSSITDHKPALDQVTLTLDAMANGGIYDQIGGGFSRYSTDSDWLVPHFEKMLYDNGQLVGLYSDTYKRTANPRYKEVVYETIEWLSREMMDESGGFYSALDADSEGVEGKYYVWTYEELKALLPESFDLFSDFYNVTMEGNWEGVTILHRTESGEQFAKRRQVSPEKLDSILEESQNILLKEREKRVRPGLDDKILAGWNGMMITGLVSAYEAFSEPKFLTLAVRNGHFIKNKLMRENKLFRVEPTREQEISGYLEDYAFVIDAFLNLYQATFDPSWLKEADKLTRYCMENFLHEEEDMFYFSDSTRLIARKKEIFDNVIPASNSQMAINLYSLGKILDNSAYSNLSDRMLGRIQPMIGKYTSDLSNWAILYGFHASPTAEVAIVGDQAEAMRADFTQTYLPNSLLMGAQGQSNYPPLMEGKVTVSGETTIYVCFNKTCKLPVHSVEEALKQIK